VGEGAQMHLLADAAGRLVASEGGQQIETDRLFPGLAVELETGEGS